MLINFVLSQPDNEVKGLLEQINEVPVESSLRDITEGYAMAYKIKSGSRLLGLEVCRIDVSHWGKRELVILRCVKARDYDLKTNFFDVLDLGEIELCKVWDCEIVRRHIDRAGMLPALEKYGYLVTEIVLKRRIKKWVAVDRRAVLLLQAARQTRIRE
ncbi:MAG: hypothetical protein WC412_07020 [Candidatus Omnitrophota bacterium]